MPKFDSKEFGLSLKNARLKKGYSQENVANEMNTGISTISRFESGKLIPNAEQISKICEILEIYVSDLFDSSNRVMNKENSMNPFKTKTLYLFYKGVYATTKKKARLKFKIEIVERPEVVEVNLVDYRSGTIYMSGYMLSDDGMAVMIFENYKPYNNKFEVGKIVVNISNNLDKMMMGALSVTNDKNIPNTRKCILSKHDLEFSDEMLQMLKITDEELAEMKSNDAWYMNITNKEDYEE